MTGPSLSTIAAIFFILLSLYVSVESLRLGVGSWREPGSGFLSFLSGVWLGILALFLLVKDIRKARNGKEGGQEKMAWKPVLIILLSLAGYIVFLEYAGFVLTTAVFVGILLKSVEKKGWFLTAWVSLVISLASYLVFKTWLQADLPKGIFTF